jgi:SAM-dependent methyltransferase
MVSLDVGCGCKPKGDVNVDSFKGGRNNQEGDQKKGEYMNPKRTPNFVVADSQHLPFKDEVFDLVFSSHCIEHVPDPLLMYREMCRVSSRKVVIRCPHRKGSGAKRPFHLHSFDETWFRQAAEATKTYCDPSVISFDYPLSGRITFAPSALKRSFPWRTLELFEWKLAKRKRFQFPFELEVNVKKKPQDLVFASPIKYIVVCNKLDVYNRCFKTSAGVTDPQITLCLNENATGLPYFYNKFITNNLSKSAWLVFCHQDFILREPLNLAGLDPFTIYGVIGAHKAPQLVGQITKTDGTLTGRRINAPTAVQTLDEVCLIAHTSVFKKGLRFDESFKFHFYGADLCLQAFSKGFGVYVIQTECQHKSATLTGDVASQFYIEAKARFRIKWQRFLPIRTSTAWFE